jgi:hypothetical protein
VEEGEDVVVPEAVAAFEEVEFDSEGEAGYFSSELLDEFDGGFHGAASGEEVVDENDALAGLDCVGVDLEGVRAVLEVVSDANGGARKLFGFTHRYEAGVEAVGEGGAEDEAAGLDAKDEVDFFIDVVLREGIDELSKAHGILEERSDVVEEDAGFGEVGDGANERFERLAVGDDGFHKRLPGSFNTKRFEIFGFLIGQIVFDDGIDATAPRTFAEGEGEIGEGVRIARGEDFDMAVFGVADPALERKSGGFAMDEPAKSDPLNAPFDEEMTNQTGSHGKQG